jgi:hypothetical protein
MCAQHAAESPPFGDPRHHNGYYMSVAPLPLTDQAKWSVSSCRGLHDLGQFLFCSALCSASLLWSTRTAELAYPHPAEGSDAEGVQRCLDEQRASGAADLPEARATAGSHGRLRSRADQHAWRGSLICQPRPRVRGGLSRAGARPRRIAIESHAPDCSSRAEPTLRPQALNSLTALREPRGLAAREEIAE